MQAYLKCSKCGVKRNAEDMPKCLVCIDIVTKTYQQARVLKRVEDRSPMHKKASVLRRTGMTYQNIGKIIGVSRQRVQQMLKI